MVYTHNGILLGNEKNEIWPFAVTWMELESVMLSEISHTEKDRYRMFSLMWILRNLIEDQRGGEGGKKLQRGKEANHKKLLNTENKLRVDSGWGREESG